MHQGQAVLDIPEDQFTERQKNGAGKQRQMNSYNVAVRYFSSERKTPAAMAEPMTPATLGPIAAISGLTLPSV